MKDYFASLNKSLDRLHSTTQKEIYLEQIADKITWCWQWRKITEEQKNILCDRVIEMRESI